MNTRDRSPLSLHRPLMGLALACVSLLSFAAPANAKTRTRPISIEKVSWQVDGEPFEGEVHFDAALLKTRKSLPAVLVVHQWMGITDHERERATRLAGMGYVAFVADVYGAKNRPASREEAGPAAGRFKKDRALFRQRLLENYGQMLARRGVDKERTAVMGFCFGGTAALELARAGAPVRAAISFHGGLDSTNPEDGKNIKASLLILHGAADPFVPAADIAAMVAELDRAKVDWQMVSYAGAVHAFTQPSAGDDPSKGAAYDAKADARSWRLTDDFLRERLQ